MKFELKDIQYIFENSLRKIVGIFCMTLGIVGLFLPILQGILLIGLGLAIFFGKNIKQGYQWIKQLFFK